MAGDQRVVRMVLHVYLQPRLAASFAAVPGAPQPHGGNPRRPFNGPFNGQRGRGRGKGFMGKAFGKGKQTSSSRIDTVKVAGQVLTICRDFNTKDGCKRTDCKFAHVCNVPRADGFACGGKHSATNHRAAPH